MADDAHSRAGRQAQFTPATEAFRIVVACFADDHVLARAEEWQRVQLSMGQGPLARGDRVAVWVFERLAQVGGDRLLQARGNGMFKCFRLRVDLAPVESENTGQE